MNARYYSPQLARFISPDPLTIHQAKGDWNPYAYALGSPLTYSDPSGLDPPASSPSTCNNSACAEPQFTPGKTTDVIPQEKADQLAIESIAQSVQWAMVQELQQPAQTYQEIKEDVAVGSTVAVGIAAGGGVLAADFTTDAALNAAIARGVGGTISGGINGAIQGKDPLDVAQGALVNGAVSLLNPGGLVGGGVFGGFTNSFLSNSTNQVGRMWIQGDTNPQFSISSAVAAGATRAVFGWGALGPGTADAAPLMVQITNGIGSGVAGGAAGGAFGQLQLTW